MENKNKIMLEILKNEKHSIISCKVVALVFRSFRLDRSQTGNRPDSG